MRVAAAVTALLLITSFAPAAEEKPFWRDIEAKPEKYGDGVKITKIVWVNQRMIVQDKKNDVWLLAICPEAPPARGDAFPSLGAVGELAENHINVILTDEQAKILIDHLKEGKKKKFEIFEIDFTVEPLKIKRDTFWLAKIAAMRVR